MKVFFQRRELARVGQEPVRVGDLTVNVESSGSVKATQSLDLPFQADGQVREVLVHPGDQVRATASVTYSKPTPGGSWSSSFVWGRNHSTETKRNTNSYLMESVFPITHKNFVTGRIELLDKDELFPGQPDLQARLGLLYGGTFRIGAYTIGYTRDIDLFRRVETGIGANFSAYSLPAAIKPFYGNHPVGGNIFVRLRLRRPG